MSDQNQTPETQTPTPTSPNPGPTNDEIMAQLASLQSLVANQNAELQNLRAGVIQNNQPPAPPPLTRDEFFENPQALIDRIAQQQQQQMAPLLEFRNQYQRQQSYYFNKSTVAKAPQFARFWQHIEPQLDAYFAQNPNIDPNVQAISFIASSILGGLAASNPAIFAQQAAPNTQVPPTIPSLPPTPSGQPSIPMRQLTENERRLAAERGMTPEQWLQNAAEGPMVMGR